MKFNKKVAIVTRYDDNYGACLQAAAMQYVLRKYEIQGEILRYTPLTERVEQNIVLKIINRIKKMGVLKVIKIALIKKYIQRRKMAFQNFRKQKILITKHTFQNADEMTKVINQYDAFICGSDMIWCEEFFKLLNVYFLQFAPRGKRIAYSPSFGREKLKEENKMIYSKLIKEIDFISCRENSGISIIKELSGKNATHTVDPTLLLTKNEWMSIMSKDNEVKGNMNYLLKYMFTELTENGKDFIKEICQTANIKMRTIPSTRFEYKEEEKNNMVGHGPFEFLSMYKHSRFIVTNTFHGLVFALIFEKPFLVFKREDSGVWAKYDERLVSLLKELDLLDRYVSQNSKFKEEWLTLDYTKVNVKINCWREDSEKYLINALQNVFTS